MTRQCQCINPNQCETLGHKKNPNVYAPLWDVEQQPLGRNTQYCKTCQKYTVPHKQYKCPCHLDLKKTDYRAWDIIVIRYYDENYHIKVQTPTDPSYKLKITEAQALDVVVDLELVECGPDDDACPQW